MLGSSSSSFAPETESAPESAIDKQTELMLDHAHALLGTFVSSVSRVDSGRWQVRSAAFPDETDWNLDVLVPSVFRSTISGGLNRFMPLKSCRLWVTDTDAVKPSDDQQASYPHLDGQVVDGQESNDQSRNANVWNWSLLGVEHWLALKPPARLALESLHFDSAFTVVISDRPNRAFCNVFAAAFELEDSEDGAYREAFLDRQPPDDVRTLHVVVAADGIPAAIASLHTTPNNLFLYNVGTHPDHRGKGLARRAIAALLNANRAANEDNRASEDGQHKAISQAKISEKFDRTVGPRTPTVWLQCEADSPAERLYEFLGFEMMFEASIIEVNTD